MLTKSKTALAFSKFDWKRALDRIALDRTYTSRALLVASRLADRAQDLTYRWGYDLLADDIGGQHRERTVRRGIAELEADGWVKRKRGGRDDNVTITLVIPDNMLSTMTATANSIPDRNGGSYRTDSVSGLKVTIQQCSASLRSAGELALATPSNAIDESWDEGNRMLDHINQSAADDTWADRIFGSIADPTGMSSIAMSS